MDCSEFLHSYSDYRDGLITDAGVLQRLRIHVAHCAPCARYDESVRRGVGALGDIDASPGFRTRLWARLGTGEAEGLEPMGAGAAGVAAALMLATAIALVIYSRRDRETPLPVAVATAVDTINAAAVERSIPFVVVNPGVPFVTFTGFSSSPFHVVETGNFQAQADAPSGTWANLPR
jgi:hypothetical protein